MAEFKMSTRAARVNADLSRKQASELAYMSLDRLRRIEDGRTQATINEAIKLCEIYGCNLENINF